MKETSYVLTKGFAACVPVRFFFSLPASIFTLLPISISHFLTANFHVFFQQNSSPLFFSSFPVIHVSTDIKI